MKIDIWGLACQTRHLYPSRYAISGRYWINNCADIRTRITAANAFCFLSLLLPISQTSDIMNPGEPAPAKSSKCSINLKDWQKVRMIRDTRALPPLSSRIKHSTAVALKILIISSNCTRATDHSLRTHALAAASWAQPWTRWYYGLIDKNEG